MKNMLMVPPTYYTVDYEINPWMNKTRKPETDLANEQWKSLYQCLQNVGVRVHLTSPGPGLNDMVFAANAGLVSDNRFIPSRFRYPQRADEAPLFTRWFENHGFEIATIPDDLFFEGEGDALFFNDILIAGYRFRSDIRAHKSISEIFNCRVLSVELINPSFYHLDTCFCPLNQDTAIYYPAAFDRYGNQVLKDLIPNLIPIETADANAFCCNAVIYDRHIIMNRCSDSLVSQLESLGFEVHLLEFDQFIKAGGSSKCMVLMLDN